ncbi:hypothetical protein KC349_g7599 [Hortaea werneckii]|nr:hypothetical protein KC349_g7599 [Hortaea werneckii]
MPADTANDNTKGRQKSAIAAEMANVKSEMAEMKSGNLPKPEKPADMANDNTKNRQKSATAADMASVGSEMTKMEPDNLPEPEKSAEMASDNTKDRQELASAADMAKVKSEMVQMKSALSKPGTLADVADDNTKDRQEFPTAAELVNIKSEMANIKSEIANVKSEMANVKSEMANIKSGGRMEFKAPTDMATVKTNNRQQSVTAAEMTDVETEMAKMKANNPTVPGTPAGRPTSKSAASTLHGTFHVKPDVSGRRHFETPAGVAKTQSTNATVRSVKPLPTPAVIELSSDTTESPTPTPPGTPKVSSEESECRQKLGAPASVLDTQSADDAVRSGGTSSIPTVIVLSSDPAESPKSTPPGTEERTIEVIVLSSDPPESASSTPSPLRNSKRLRAISPDTASKRPRPSSATEGKLQTEAGSS